MTRGGAGAGHHLSVDDLSHQMLGDRQQILVSRGTICGDSRHCLTCTAEAAFPVGGSRRSGAQQPGDSGLGEGEELIGDDGVEVSEEIARLHAVPSWHHGRRARYRPVKWSTPEPLKRSIAIDPVAST